MHLSNFASYRVNNLNFTTHQVTVNGVVNLSLDEGLSAKSEGNVLLFVIRQDNEVVYPIDTKFMTHETIPLAPLAIESLPVQLNDLIVFIVPHQGKAHDIGVSRQRFYGSLMHCGEIHSSEEMAKQLETVININPNLKSGYSILAMNVTNVHSLHITEAKCHLSFYFRRPPFAIMCLLLSIPWAVGIVYLLHLLLHLFKGIFSEEFIVECLLPFTQVLILFSVGVISRRIH